MGVYDIAATSGTSQLRRFSCPLQRSRLEDVTEASRRERDLQYVEPPLYVSKDARHAAHHRQRRDFRVPAMIVLALASGQEPTPPTDVDRVTVRLPTPAQARRDDGRAVLALDFPHSPAIASTTDIGTGLLLRPTVFSAMRVSRGSADRVLDEHPRPRPWAARSETVGVVALLRVPFVRPALRLARAAYAPVPAAAAHQPRAP